MGAETRFLNNGFASDARQVYDLPARLPTSRSMTRFLRSWTANLMGASQRQVKDLARICVAEPLTRLLATTR